MQEDEGWFACDGYRMRYVHLSAANGYGLWWWWQPRRPAVVFVHGLMGYSFSWRSNLEFFRKHRDVYALDFLGVGHSDRPKAGETQFDLESAAGRLLRFLQSLGHAKIDLVATSHGGAVAMLAASRDYCSARPLIRRLVLAAPAHPFMDDTLRAAMQATSLGKTLVGSFGPMVQNQAMAQMYADEANITPEARAGYAVNFQDERSYDYALAVAQSWKTDMQKLEAALPAISRIPALLLWGDKDETVPARSAARLQRCFRAAELEILPGIGHLPYEEAPEEFNRRVLRFLEQ
jgi:pimeloyl-ACP methyl ester carboxylesterase